MSRAGRLVQAATVDPGALGTAARAAAAVTACVAVGQAIDEPAFGLFAAMGAVNVAVADTGGPYAERMSAMVVGLAGICAALAAGAALSRTPWPAIAVLAVVAFLAGLIRAHGPVGAKVGLVTTLSFLLSSGLPGPWADVWQRPVSAAVGGLGTIVLVVWSWPLRPDRPARRSLVATFGAIATLAEACAGEDEPAIREARIRTRKAREELRRELDSLGGWRPGSDPSVVRLARLGLEATRLDASLGVLARMVVAEPGSLTAAAAGEAKAVAGVARSLATAVGAGGGAVELESLTRAEEVARQAQEQASRPTLVEAVLEVAADRCRAAARLAAETETPELLRPFLWRSPTAAFGEVAGTARRQLRPGSTGFRYAAQLAVATAAADSLSLAYGLERAYWAPLTATVVLQPVYGLTARRTVDRVIGTVAGALATALVLGVVSSDLVIDLLIFGAGFAAFLLLLRQVLRWAAVAVTALVLCLIETVDPSRWQLAKYRVLDTLVGAAVALAVAGLMRWRPDPLSTGRELALPVEAARNYLEAYLDDGADALDRRLVARRHLDDALARAEEVAGLLDPADAARAGELVQATRRFADAVQGLELVSSDPGSGLPTAIQAIGEQLVSALDELATSLERHGTPGLLPELEPPLRTVGHHAGSRPEDTLEGAQAARLVETARALAAAAAG